jgi:hypothetical protein
LEKLESAEWDLNVLIKMAKDKKEELENEWRFNFSIR